MSQTADSTFKNLKQGNYDPIYFLQGDEAFYIDQIADFIEQNAIPEHEQSFNQIVIYGKDVDMNTILSNARRFPMMGEKQLVLVKEAQNISDLNRESGSKSLEAYLNSPQPSTILVFCHKYKQLDKRKSVAKLLEKKATVVTTKKLYDNQIPDWINSHVKNRGHNIAPKAAYMIAEFIGNNLERINNEIEKVLLNFQGNVTITEEHVEKYIGISKEYNAFELQKAITTKDVLKANQIVNYFGENPKQNPVIPIVAMLFSYFSKLLKAHHTQDKSDRNLASLLGINPYFVKDYKVGLNHYGIGKVIANIKHLRYADLQSKGVEIGTVNDGQILKELVFKLLH